MAIDAIKNRHRLNFASHSVTHWKDGVACGINDNWTHRQICVAAARIEFDRSQEREFSKIVRALDNAYAAGISQCKRDIRDLLEI